MIFQQVLIGLFFASAVAYVGSALYKTFRSKAGCASGCGKCSTIDFAKIEQQVRSKEQADTMLKPRP